MNHMTMRDFVLQANDLFSIDTMSMRDIMMNDDGSIVVNGSDNFELTSGFLEDYYSILGLPQKYMNNVPPDLRSANCNYFAVRSNDDVTIAYSGNSLLNVWKTGTKRTMLDVANAMYSTLQDSEIIDAADNEKFSEFLVSFSKDAVMKTDNNVYVSGAIVYASHDNKAKIHVNPAFIASDDSYFEMNYDSEKLYDMMTFEELLLHVKDVLMKQAIYDVSTIGNSAIDKYALRHYVNTELKRIHVKSSERKSICDSVLVDYSDGDTYINVCESIMMSEHQYGLVEKASIAYAAGRIFYTEEPSICKLCHQELVDD